VNACQSQAFWLEASGFASERLVSALVGLLASDVCRELVGSL
jgi:hypothetical protein